MEQWKIMEQCELMSRAQYAKALNHVSPRQRYNALCASIMANAADAWERTTKQKEEQKRACYFSAEFLMGRAIYNNLFALGKLDEVKKQWSDAGFDPTEWEMEEDAALGNGGLGRLAACFLDSVATHDLPLDGYGIHYRFGLFKQCIEDGCQHEEPDDWTKWGDPWCVRREEDAVVVQFAEQTMKAVPYDMPVIGFGGKTINTLRLWQSEPINAIDLGAFNEQNYFKSSKEYDEAICISQILYPNDTMKAGKQLRLKQEYFFTSASLQDILKKFKAKHGSYDRLPELLAVQLNDTHPILAIPELLRLLCADGVSWDKALSMAKEIFSYTNHTVMAEAMERWDVELMKSVVPQIFPIIEKLDEELKAELKAKDIPEEQWKQYALICDNSVHMARIGSYISKKINGVAQIHSEILRKDTLKQWETLYPGKILNETNGITPRRW
ncbi:MAG: glycogen/starch/alpha-glucan phosphorylase, partial [Oscillospiraceae bacterium]|nr:glycogen/starch/alpha-glucan phosphorylase [Oscillospiraceae bacterium]